MPSWTFGPFLLEPARSTLSRDGVALAVQPLVLDLLVLAAENPGVLLTRERLFDTLWPDVVVTDHSLTQLTHQVRKALGEHRHWWVTVPRKGYRFDAPVEQRSAAGVPASPHTLFGRDALLDRAETLLTEGARWLLVHGPGGIGKTRATLALFERQHDAWPWSAWVDLSADRSADAVTEALGTALGIDLPSSGAAERVGRALAVRGAGLIGVDNLEQLDEPAIAALRAWHQAAPDVRWIGTSRSLPDLPALTVLEVPPLPPEDARLLFTTRAAAAGAPPLDPDDAVLTAIVETLEGLPLSIELAAARAALLDPSSMLRRLDAQLELLAGGRGPQRHQSMRAAIQWSWELLEPPTRQVLAVCGLFAGGFTVDLVEQVCGDHALDHLQALQRQSLIQPVRSAVPSPVRRLTLHRSVRDFVTGALDTVDPDRVLQLRFVEVVRRLYTRSLGLLHAWDDTVAAQVATQAPAARIAVALAPTDTELAAAVAIGLHAIDRLQAASEVWSPHASATSPRAILARVVRSSPADLDGLLPEALAQVDAHLARDETGQAAELLRLLAQRAVTGGRHAEGLDLATRAHDLAVTHGDPGIQASTCLPLAGANMRLGDHAASLAACDEGLRLLGAEQARLRSALLDVRGKVSIAQGAYATASHTLTEALGLAEQAGLGIRSGSIRMNLASLLCERGDSEAAYHAETEVLELFRRQGWAHAEAVSHNNRAYYALLSGQLDRVRPDLDQALATTESPYVARLVHTNRCLLHLLEGDHRRAFALAEQGVAALGEGHADHLGALRLYQAVTHVVAGEPDRALAVERALQTELNQVLSTAVSEAWDQLTAHCHGLAAPAPRSPLGRVIREVLDQLRSG